MKNLLENKNLAATILSTIWLRKPIIFYTDDKNNFDRLIQEIIHFIPDYRQLIFYGQVPKTIIYNKFRPKVLNTDDLKSIEISLIQSFEEENIHAPPLQLIFFDANEWILTNLLKQFEKGWIAFTFADVKKIQEFFESNDMLSINAENYKIIFPKGGPDDKKLEYKLINKARNRTLSTVRILLQKKMNEIRFTAQALLEEIEAGRKINQLEIEECFEIDSLNFAKVLDILKVEARLNVKPYIQLIPKYISLLLDKLSKISGVDTIACLHKNELLGIVRNKDFEFIPQQLFSPFVSFLNYLNDLNEWGSYQQINLELQNGIKMLFFKKDEISKHRNLTFAAIIDRKSNAFLVLKEIKNILKEL